eukprot:12761792-Alexandrium_andersonii.AAC.2
MAAADSEESSSSPPAQRKGDAQPAPQPSTPSCPKASSKPQGECGGSSVVRESSASLGAMSSKNDL